MIAATSTMWDTLSWGGETQALIYNPNTGKVIGINGLGMAPTGATPEYFHKLGMKFPPEYGAAGRGDAGHPGRPHDHARRVRHDELAAGARACDRNGGRLSDGEPNSSTPSRSTRTRSAVAGLAARDAHPPGQRRTRRRMRVRSSISRNLRRRCASSWKPRSQALAAGKDRKAAIYAAYERFYKGDIARNSCAACARPAGSSRSRISPTGR